MKSYTEDNLQADCHIFLNNTYGLKHHNPRLIGFSVPNGGLRNSFEAAKLKATGLRPGVADYIVLLPYGRTLFIEFKIENGVQSPVQKEFESEVTALGFEYKIIRTLEAFKELIYEKMRRSNP